MTHNHCIGLSRLAFGHAERQDDGRDKRNLHERLMRKPRKKLHCPDGDGCAERPVDPMQCLLQTRWIEYGASIASRASAFSDDGLWDSVRRRALDARSP